MDKLYIDVFYYFFYIISMKKETVSVVAVVLGLTAAVYAFAKTYNAVKDLEDLKVDYSGDSALSSMFNRMAGKINEE